MPKDSASDWRKDWRLSTFNGALLACYFIPAWTIAAMKIWISPVHGMYDRANIAPGMFISDHLSFSALQTVRLTWMLALGKVVVAAFFLLFLVMIVRESVRRQGSCDEALGFALLFGSLISMASLLAASQVGEFEAVRLHASETLALIGAGILLLIDMPERVATPVTSSAHMPHGWGRYFSPNS
jgi:xanthine/uracil/vitamin C permease (AzgA family)